MNKEANERLEGLVREIIFENEETGYKVLELEDAEGDLVTAVGILPGIRPGVMLTAEGFTDNHQTYGEQFRVCSFSCAYPQGRQAMERYLASGAVKGVGAALARRIVEKFGDEAFDIMEREPERLAEVKGIGQAAACSIGEQFAAGRELRDILIFLQDYGISPTMAVAIYQRFGNQTVGKIRENPYILADSVRGIGFERADEIARRMGMPEDAPARLEACALYLLAQAAAAEGHCYLPFAELMDRICGKTAVEVQTVENVLTELSLKGRVVIRRECVFLTALYRAENSAALRLTELKGRRRKKYKEYDLTRVQELRGLSLSPQQEEAVRAALTEGVLIITGGPGTGKTTIINVLLDMLEEQKEDYLLAAPTGRAAKRMQEATGRGALTLHRLLEVKAVPDAFGGIDSRQLFQRDAEHPLETDVVIVDEMSMVDIQLFSALLKALAPGTRLILVGDKDQLPSVGAGNVLHDLIDSGLFPTVTLTEIYRQGEGSDIVRNAHRILAGEYPEFNRKDTDFFLVREQESAHAAKTLCDLVKRRIPQFAHLSPMEIQVLSPQHKGDLGTDSLNRQLQAQLNPPGPHKAQLEFRDTLFREGDRVMQIRNDYDTAWTIRNEYGVGIEEGLGVFNGDIGRVSRVRPSEKTVTVCFDDKKEVEYDYPSLEDLVLAYCITIHKSQGSQSPVVVLPLLWGPAPLYSRNLLYTAVTRAQRYVMVVGSENTVRRMVDNQRESERYTALCELLKETQALLP